MSGDQQKTMFILLIGKYFWNFFCWSNFEYEQNLWEEDYLNCETGM